MLMTSMLPTMNVSPTVSDPIPSPSSTVSSLSSLGDDDLEGYVTSRDLNDLLHSEVDAKRARMDGWDVRMETDDVVAITQATEGGNLRVRASCIIRGHHPFVLFDMISDPVKNVKFGSSWKDMRVVKRGVGPKKDNELMHFVLNTPFGVTTRDFSQVRRVLVDHENRQYVIAYRDAPEEVAAAPEDGVVRAETIGVIGYAIREIAPGVCKVTLTTALDAKGLIPKAVINFVAARAPKEWSGNLQKACDKHGRHTVVPKEARRNEDD